MKKLAFAFIAASCLVFGIGHAASAQYPGAGVSPAQPTAGGAYSVTYSGCNVGDTIRFTQPDSTPSTIDSPCVSSVVLTGSIIGLLLPQQIGGGTAVANFTAAPTAPGTYNGTAVGTQSVDPSPSQAFSFTIPGQATTTTIPATTVAPPVTTAPVATTAPPLAGGLPATGSDGIGTTTSVAIALLVVGLGLFVVAQVRRRQAPTTA